MIILTVRNVPDEVHRAIRIRAAQHGRNVETEVREILANAVEPDQRLRVGDALAELGKSLGLNNEDCAMLDQVRDTTPAVPIKPTLDSKVRSCPIAAVPSADSTLLPWA